MPAIYRRAAELFRLLLERFQHHFSLTIGYCTVQLFFVTFLALFALSKKTNIIRLMLKSTHTHLSLLALFTCFNFPRWWCVCWVLYMIQNNRIHYSRLHEPQTLAESQILQCTAKVSFHVVIYPMAPDKGLVPLAQITPKDWAAKTASSFLFYPRVLPSPI